MKYAKYDLVLKKSKMFESKYEYNIKEGADVYRFAKRVIKATGFPEERLYAVNISAKGDVVGVFEVSKGTIDSSNANPRDVFKAAIVQNAAAVIVFHNHPSGDPTPSAGDIEATKRLAESGKILGIQLLDHLVVGDGQFISLRAEGVIA